MVKKSIKEIKPTPKEIKEVKEKETPIPKKQHNHWLYAIAIGFNPGIYFNNWEEVKPQIEGFKGAKYKGFKKQQEAKEYLAQNQLPIPKVKNNFKWYKVIHKTRKLNKITNDFGKIILIRNGFGNQVKFRGFNSLKEAESWNGENIIKKDEPIKRKEKVKKNSRKMKIKKIKIQIDLIKELLSGMEQTLEELEKESNSE